MNKTLELNELELKMADLRRTNFENLQELQEDAGLSIERDKTILFCQEEIQRLMGLSEDLKDKLGSSLAREMSAEVVLLLHTIIPYYYLIL